MTTKLSKPISRVTGETVRDAGKVRNLVATLYPNGTVGLRPQGTRREEFYPLEAVYFAAVKARVAAVKAAKGRKAK